MSILFNNNVVTYIDTLDKGIDGLVKLTGIGPKKAEGLIDLAGKIKERLEKKALELEVSPESKEDIAEIQTVYEAEEQQKITEEKRKKNAVNEDEELEDEEIPIRDLSGFSTKILNTLENNGFETLAELSVTPLEELIAIDGLDENLGLEILEKVKQQLSNIENA